MSEFSLLEFFRAGKFGPIELGMTRTEVKHLIGAPDIYWDCDGESEDDSAIWYYGGIELFWYPLDPKLHMISFQPYMLFRGHGKRKPWITKISRWVFRSSRGPTAEQLKLALDKQKIPYQDTGLDIIIWRDSASGYDVIPYKEMLHSNNDEDDVFGTLVLKSGVEVRYSKNGMIIKVAIDSEFWIIKGSEQFVKF
jgi:hypothetical protein